MYICKFTFTYLSIVISVLAFSFVENLILQANMFLLFDIFESFFRTNIKHSKKN